MALRQSFALDCVAVGSGAVIGAVLRHSLAEWAVRRGRQPWGIAAVNIIGSFVLGAVAVMSPLSPRHKLLLGTGLCGSFTTFSTFSVDMVHLLEAERWGTAAGYFAGTLCPPCTRARRCRTGKTSLPLLALLPPSGQRTTSGAWPPLVPQCGSSATNRGHESLPRELR